MTTVFVVLEHVETGARRRQQHHVARPGSGAALRDGFEQGACTNQRHGITDGLADLVGVAAHEDHGAAVGRHRITQVLELGTLAVAAGDQHDLAVDVRTQAFDGCQRGADVGGFGVVVVNHAIQVADPMATMHEPGDSMASNGKPTA